MKYNTIIGFLQYQIDSRLELDNSMTNHRLNSCGFHCLNFRDSRKIFCIPRVASQWKADISGRKTTTVSQNPVSHTYLYLFILWQNFHLFFVQGYKTDFANISPIIPSRHRGLKPMIESDSLYTIQLATLFPSLALGNTTMQWMVFGSYLGIVNTQHCLLDDSCQGGTMCDSIGWHHNLCKAQLSHSGIQSESYCWWEKSHRCWGNMRELSCEAWIWSSCTSSCNRCSARSKRSCTKGKFKESLWNKAQVYFQRYMCVGKRRYSLWSESLKFRSPKRGTADKVQLSIEQNLPWAFSRAETFRFPQKPFVSTVSWGNHQNGNLSTLCMKKLKILVLLILK